MTGSLSRRHRLRPLSRVRCGALLLTTTLLAACAGAAPSQATHGAPPSHPEDRRSTTHDVARRPPPPPSTATTSSNPLVLYLRGAELQCETDAQLANIRRALDDLATLPVATLRSRRYADYAGTLGAWDLPQLIRSHFVPENMRDAGVIDDPSAFWTAAASEEVRVLARKMVEAIDHPRPDADGVLVPLQQGP